MLHFIFIVFTDSIIYIAKPGQLLVETGPFLGDMTNELKSFGPDAYIAEFAAGGPKNYAYRVAGVNGEIIHESHKVRGIRLNFEKKQTINFDKLKSMIFAFVSGEQMVETLYEKKILRNAEREVFTTTCKKDYRVVYTKRKMIDKFCTLPFGY